MAFMTSGQETEWPYSYSPGAHTGLGGRVVRTSDSDSRVEGSPPSNDTAWLFISEAGDRLWR